MDAKALMERLADTLQEGDKQTANTGRVAGLNASRKPKTLANTLGNVDADALVHTLENRLANVNAHTLGDTLRQCTGEDTALPAG